ncbi:MAG TPA: Rieske (2Fe-2S) protein [Edaphobacter sp.]|nr:Rieske (2Fe-2S) protein [Edaphobacter sp.]
MSEHESEQQTGESRPGESRLNSEPKAASPSASDPGGPKDHSRRVFLFKVSLLVNGAVGVVLAVPILRYLLGPVIRKSDSYHSWITLGDVNDFPEGQTRLAKYRNPSTTPWDGQTADIPCWVRRVAGNKFQVFAINCAHLGCPVRWFSESKLFLCPCHGGAYYENGERAAGPPERGLFEYKYRVAGAKLLINAGEMPTLSTPASGQSANFVPLDKIGCSSCQG